MTIEPIDEDGLKFNLLNTLFWAVIIGICTGIYFIWDEVWFEIVKVMAYGGEVR